MDCLSSRVRDQPGQHSETPSLLKYKKSAGHGGPLAIPAIREAETGESLEPWGEGWSGDRATALQPGQKRKEREASRTVFPLPG